MLPVARSSRLMKNMGLQGVIRGKTGTHNSTGQGGAVPARSRQPAVPGACAEHAVGVRTSPMSRPGAASSMLLSSSTPMPAGSLAGASAARHMLALCSMPWSRPFTIDDHVRGASSIIRIVASQYVSIKYTERLAEAGIEPSVGSVGDSYDNALAETINGLYKAEVIHRVGPWRSFEAVEYRHARMGRLVQQPATAGTHRQHPASRSRSKLLRQLWRNCRHGRVT